MTESFSLTQGQALSPAFDRARRISGFLSVILSIGFWLVLVVLVLIVCGIIALLIIQPDPATLKDAKLGVNGVKIQLDKLSEAQRLIAAAALVATTAPTLFILHHARRVFRHFRQGEVFQAAPIEHIRQTGIWLMISLGASFVGEILIDLAVRPQPEAIDLNTDPLSLLFGLAVYVAASVMQEARRIADDHANII